MIRRLLPKSLAGQLGGLLIAALFAAHLLGLLLFSGERRHAIETALRFGVVDRIAALVEVINDASPELGDRLAAALSSHGTRLAIASESSLPAGQMDAAEADFAAD